MAEHNSWNKKPSSSAKVQQANHRKKLITFDWRAILGIFALIGVIVVATLINNQDNADSVEEITKAIDIDNGDLKINWDRYATKDIILSDSLTINQSGTYHLTGNLDDGCITIEAGIGEVKLILDNVMINNNSGPAIYGKSAEDIVIELIGENTISDGTNYANSFESDVKGAIYVKSDFTLQGEGDLNVIANHEDGIVGKDDLTFRGGNYKITSIDDAIRGTDSVYITSGNFNIDSKADAIKSTDESNYGKGFVLIENGNLNIKSSAKGIKATKNILIENGFFNLDTYDDAIHSDIYLGIVNGNITINANDDAIHANNTLVIDGGNINITKAYEGIEAQVITINSGVISVTAIDDGINTGGGADASATTDRPGGGPFDSDENCILTINGGEIKIDSSGDGIDSNGWIYINDGIIVVDGPTNNGNSALDSGLSIIQNGGEILAVGSSGMAESISNTSAVNNISVFFDIEQPAGTTITIKNSNNETIVEHTAIKKFSHLAIGTGKFVLGNTYAIFLNNEKYQDFTIVDTTTTVGDNNQNFNNHININK